MCAAEPFVLNPDNRPLLEEGAPPSALASNRNDEMIGGTYLILVIGVLLSGIMAVLAVLDWMDWGALRDSGVQTEATITGRRIDTSGEGTAYYVSYTYQHIPADGDPRTYHSEERVNSGTYDDAEQGRRVAALYTPADPEHVTIDVRLEPPWIQTVGMLFSVGLFIVVPLLIISHDRRRAQVEQRLRQSSSMLPGEVVTCTGNAADDDYHVRLTYRFQSTHSGKTIQKAQRLQRNDMNDASLPAPGTPVIVLYRDDQTFQVL
jgi:hypothetical protein